MTTRREYFMQNPDEFEKYVWKWRGEKPSKLDKDRARRHKEYIGIYLCDNMKDCESCPVPLHEDGLCDDRLDEWLDTRTAADMSDIVPEDREAVQKIFDRAIGNAEQKDHTCVDGAETSKKASEMVKPAHYELLPNVNVIDVIKAVLCRTDYKPDDNFYLGNAIKYVLRADQKGGTEDYKKAITYLTWLVDSLE